jgi:large subunit ribosomal protein L9
MKRKRKMIGVGGTCRNSVELLLAEDVLGLGIQGALVRVKPGYARNFLVPQGLATIATEHNRRMVERHKKQIADLRLKQLKSLRDLASRIGKYSVTIEAKANPDGHLYGSIVAVDISKALRDAKFNIDSEHVRLEGPLKELGMYTVKIQLHADVKADVKVWVVPESEA